MGYSKQEGVCAHVRACVCAHVCVCVSEGEADTPSLTALMENNREVFLSHPGLVP